MFIFVSFLLVFSIHFQNMMFSFEMEQSTAESFAANNTMNPIVRQQNPIQLRSEDIIFSDNNQFVQSPADKENKNIYEISKGPQFQRNNFFNSPSKDQPHFTRNNVYNSPPTEQYSPRNDFYNSPPREHHQFQAYSPPIQSSNRQPFHDYQK